MIDMKKREVIARLLDLSAIKIGGSKHERWQSPTGHCKTSVPRHYGDLPIGTIRAIENDMKHCFGEGWLRR